MEHQIEVSLQLPSQELQQRPKEFDQRLPKASAQSISFGHTSPTCQKNISAKFQNKSNSPSRKSQFSEALVERKTAEWKSTIQKVWSPKRHHQIAAFPKVTLNQDLNNQSNSSMDQKRKMDASLQHVNPPSKPHLSYMEDLSYDKKKLGWHLFLDILSSQPKQQEVAKYIEAQVASKQEEEERNQKFKKEELSQKLKNLKIKLKRQNQKQFKSPRNKRVFITPEPIRQEKSNVPRLEQFGEENGTSRSSQSFQVEELDLLSEKQLSTKDQKYLKQQEAISKKFGSMFQQVDSLKSNIKKTNMEFKKIAGKLRAQSISPTSQQSQRPRRRIKIQNRALPISYTPSTEEQSRPFSQNATPQPQKDHIQVTDHQQLRESKFHNFQYPRQENCSPEIGQFQPNRKLSNFIIARNHIETPTQAQEDQAIKIYDSLTKRRKVLALRLNEMERNLLQNEFEENKESLKQLQSLITLLIKGNLAEITPSDLRSLDKVNQAMLKADIISLIRDSEQYLLSESALSSMSPLFFQQQNTLTLCFDEEGKTHQGTANGAQTYLNFGSIRSVTPSLQSGKGVGYPQNRKLSLPDQSEQSDQSLHPSMYYERQQKNKIVKFESLKPVLESANEGRKIKYSEQNLTRFVTTNNLSKNLWRGQPSLHNASTLKQRVGERFNALEIRNSGLSAFQGNVPGTPTISYLTKLSALEEQNEGNQIVKAVPYSKFSSMTLKEQAMAKEKHLQGTTKRAFSKI